MSLSRKPDGQDANPPNPSLRGEGGRGCPNSPAEPPGKGWGRGGLLPGGSGSDTCPEDRDLPGTMLGGDRTGGSRLVPSRPDGLRAGVAHPSPGWAPLGVSPSSEPGRSWQFSCGASRSAASARPPGAPRPAGASSSPAGSHRGGHPAPHLPPGPASPALGRGRERLSDGAGAGAAFSAAHLAKVSGKWSLP